jgi:negative regulator of sigma E activity
MDSFFARNRLSAYLDGTLPEAEAAEVRAAVAADPALAAELAEMSRTVQFLRARGRAKAPAGLHARVMGRIAREPAPNGLLVRLRFAVNRLPVEAVALAAAVLIVIGVVRTMGAAPDPDAAPPPRLSAAREAPAPTAAAPAEAPTPTVDPALPPAEVDAVAQAEARAAARGVEIAPGPPDALAESPRSRLGRSPGAAGRSPYSPAWESGAAVAGDDHSPGALTLTLAWDVHTTDPDAPRQLAAVAADLGGRLLTADGRSAGLGPLTDDNDFRRVVVAIPPASLQSLEAHLLTMGARELPAPSSPPPLPDGHVGAVVELRFAP